MWFLAGPKRLPPARTSPQKSSTSRRLLLGSASSCRLPTRPASATRSCSTTVVPTPSRLKTPSERKSSRFRQARCGRSISPITPPLRASGVLSSMARRLPSPMPAPWPGPASWLSARCSANRCPSPPSTPITRRALPTAPRCSTGHLRAALSHCPTPRWSAITGSCICGTAARARLSQTRPASSRSTVPCSFRSSPANPRSSPLTVQISSPLASASRPLSRSITR